MKKIIVVILLSLATTAFAGSQIELYGEEVDFRYGELGQAYEVIATEEAYGETSENVGRRPLESPQRCELFGETRLIVLEEVRDGLIKTLVRFDSGNCKAGLIVEVPPSLLGEMEPIH